MPSELAYKIHGSGQPKLVLVHGWMTSQQLWDDVVASLGDSVGPILTIDMLGFGASAGHEQAPTLENQSAAIRSLLDELKVDRVAVAGHSMGGVVAQLLALEAPARVTDLVLLAPVPASGFPLPPEAYANFEALGENRAALQAFFEPQFADPARVPAFVDIAMQASDEVAKQSLHAWTHADFADRLSLIKARTLVVCGGKDPFLGAELLQSRVADRIDGATLKTLDSGGHYLVVDDPAGVAQLIRDHLS